MIFAYLDPDPILGPNGIRIQWGSGYDVWIFYSIFFKKIGSHLDSELYPWANTADLDHHGSVSIGKQGPNSYQSQKPNPDLHHSPNSGALKAKNRGMEGEGREIRIRIQVKRGIRILIRYGTVLFRIRSTEFSNDHCKFGFAKPFSSRCKCTNVH